MTRSHVLRLPSLDGWESPCSLITRVAASQGATLAEMCAYLGLTPEFDLDISVAIRARCEPPGRSIGLERLHVARRIFSALVASGVETRRYLLHAASGSPRYRYCPLCINEVRVVALPVHWRFAAWRVCPVHAVLLEDQCPHCSAHLVLPCDLSTAGPSDIGVASLRLCLKCARSLTDVVPVKADQDLFARYGTTVQLLAENGQALLAALWYRSFRTTRSPDLLPLTRLFEVDVLGAVPNEPDWMAPHLLRRASGEAGPTAGCGQGDAQKNRADRLLSSLGGWSGARLGMFPSGDTGDE